MPEGVKLFGRGLFKALCSGAEGRETEGFNCPTITTEGHGVMAWLFGALHKVKVTIPVGMDTFYLLSVACGVLADALSLATLIGL